jgi:hypothetical protein
VISEFRQVLPVIEIGSRNEIIDAFFITSPLWRHVTILNLKENTHLRRPDFHLFILKSFLHWPSGFWMLVMVIF